jgi:hypothetical protein
MADPIILAAMAIVCFVIGWFGAWFFGAYRAVA